MKTKIIGYKKKTIEKVETMIEPGVKRVSIKSTLKGKFTFITEGPPTDEVDGETRAVMIRETQMLNN